ncbi:carboxypeptidase B-like [Aplysia californica]|uniref:Carboxypeptidase B-like n=1 Tax=Aplysia californica TaxID=6500 RepID=A0ABM1VRW7_APLCA|nr:carboxypeptidase B-like [Aplysia californica]
MSLSFLPQIESRLWRKSRSTAYSDIPECVGVDLNRNFGFEWNDSPLYGGSSNPCSGTYSGPHSFSEPETRNLRDLLLSNKDAIKGYLTFHSFGQFFLYPWGFSSDVDIEDERDLVDPAAGASDDYVRGTVGVKYAYTVELPPHESSSYGFLLPEEEVKTIVSDTWDGVKAFAFHLHKHVYTPRERYFLDMLLNIANNSLNLLENNTALNTENAS